jgi:hypothetical protein
VPYFRTTLLARALSRIRAVLTRYQTFRRSVRVPRASKIKKRGQTMDLLFVGITSVFFLASWGFVKLCEHI